MRSKPVYVTHCVVCGKIIRSTQTRGRPRKYCRDCRKLSGMKGLFDSPIKKHCLTAKHYKKTPSFLRKIIRGTSQVLVFVIK